MVLLAARCCCCALIRLPLPLLLHAATLDAAGAARPLISACFLSHRYAAIAGVPHFLDKALAFAYGDDCKPLKEGRIVGVQTLSGTGACRIAGDFYAKFLPEGTAIYVSDPTWGNHIPMYASPHELAF